MRFVKHIFFGFVIVRRRGKDARNKSENDANPDEWIELHGFGFNSI